jgi:hypothetical protein
MFDIGLPDERVLFGINPLDSEELIIRSQHVEVCELGEAAPMVEGKQGAEYNFVVRATAVRHYWGKRNYEVDNKKEWIRRRIENNGAAVLELVYKPAHVWCAKDSGFYIPEVIALGKLRVDDAVKLRNAMYTGSGISRHRAFGFGLLQLIAPKGQ